MSFFYIIVLLFNALLTLLDQCFNSFMQKSDFGCAFNQKFTAPLPCQHSQIFVLSKALSWGPNMC